MTHPAVLVPSGTPEVLPAVVAGPSSALSVVRPLAASVGDLGGLGPGEVPAADVRLADGMAEPDASLVRAWLAGQRRAATRRAYLADVCAFRRWLDAHLAGLPLVAVTEDVLVGYRDSLGTGTALAGVRRVGVPLSSATIGRRLASLSAFYRYALRRRAVTTNPADREATPRPVLDSRATPALSHAEVTALLAAAEALPDRQDAAAVALLVGLGVRVGEVVAVLVGDVVQDSGHTVLVVRGKGGKARRLPVPPRFRLVLDALLADRDPGEVLLVRDGGRPWDRWRVTTALHRAARAADLAPERLTPHVLRATAVTLLLDAGVPLRDVQALAGHASPRTTQGYDRGAGRLDGHAAYRLAGLLG